MRFIYFLFGLFLPVVLFGQSTMLNDKQIRQEINEGLAKMYNMEFEEAEKHFVKVKEKYPDHPAYDLLQSMSLSWEVTYNNNFKESSEEGLAYINGSLKKSAKLLAHDSNDPEGIFFTLAGHASLALYYSQTGQTLKSVNEARKAYGLIKKADKLREKMIDFNFPVGLYNYYVIQYPENHPAFKPFMFFFMSGDKQKGLEELKICAESGVFSRTETTFYLSHIYLRYEEDYEKALEYSARLIKDFPNNIYFKVNHCEALIGAGRYGEAEYLAYDLYKTNRIFAKLAAYTYYGLLNERYFHKPETAKAYFTQALGLAQKCDFPVQDFTGQCYAGLGRYYASKGDEDQAVFYYNKCLEVTDYLHLMKESEAYIDEHD